MRLLLDTHALIWWLPDDRRLGDHARNLIGDRANEILVSAGSLWEILVKVRVGKLIIDVEDMLRQVTALGFELLGIAPAHLLVLATLPTYHKDPFDHLLIAQAIAEDALFMSEDRNVYRYPVRFIACSANPPALDPRPGLR